MKMLKHIYALLTICTVMALVPCSLYAQKFGPYQNGAAASGKAAADNRPVNDVSIVKFNYPMIGLGKVASAPVPAAGGSYDVTYTFYVKNFGQLDLYGVQIFDTLTKTFPSPATYTVTSVTATGTLTAAAAGVFTGTAAASALLDSSNSTLAVGATATIELKVNFKNGGTLYTFNNSARAIARTNDGTGVFDVSHNNINPDENGNNNPFDDYTPTPVNLEKHNLVITKTVDQGLPYIGDTVTFTVTVKNNGPGGAPDVVINDLLPNGYTFVSATADAGAYNETTGVWDGIGTMANGDSHTLTVKASVKITGTYLNVASNTQPGDSDTSDNEADTSVAPKPVADVQITKTASDMTPAEGTHISFTLTAYNNGPSDATAVVVIDTLRAGYTIDPSLPADITYDNATRIITWQVGSLANAATATVTFPVTVNTGHVAPDYGNTAIISIAEKDPKPGNDTSRVSVAPVQVANLAIVKSIDATTPNPLYVGNNITFKMVVTNNGPGPATDVKVADTLRAGYTFVSAAPVGKYDNTTGIWDIGTLANGATATLTITATVNATGTDYDYRNVAIARSHEDNDPSDNIDSTEKPVITPAADLQVEKTVDRATANVGSQVKFTIKVTNHGPSKATDINMTDVLPAGLSFVSAAPNNYNTTTHIWHIAELENQKDTTLEIIAQVVPSTATDAYKNKADVLGAEFDKDLTNNTSSATVTATPAADLAVTKVVDNSTPDGGTNVVFTITAKNNGLSNATGVKVTDLLKAGYTYVSKIPSVGTYDESTGEWNIGNLSNGATETLKITAKVVADKILADYENFASIDGNELDTVPTNDTITIGVTPTVKADISVKKVVSNKTPDVGTNVTFTITASNAGPNAATNVIVTDVLPSGYDYVSSTPSTGTYSNTTGEWNIGGLAIAGSATLTIEAKVKVAGDYKNLAAISSTTVNDPDPSNNKDSATTTPVPVADLAVTKTVNNGTPDVGTDVTFTMTVKNNGPSDATGVTVTDILKSGYTYVSSTPSKGTYNNTTGVWQVGGLAAGVTETLTVTATVKTSGDYTNNVSATGTEKDNDPSNNSKDTATVPVAVADLAITKVASNMSPDKGTEIDFTLTVTNKGISDAHNVKATDLLPTGYSYVSSTPSVGTYSNTTGVWTIGDLSATTGSNTATLGIKVKVNAVGTGDDYKNVATVTGDEKDPVTTNNADSTKPAPVEIADLSVTKTVSNKTPDVGTNVTFTITAANAGVNDATGVVVKDPLPSGYDYVSSTPSVGTYNNTTGNWTIGALAASGSATLTIEAKVKAAGEYKNIAIIEGPSTLKDPNTDNNLDSARTTPVPVADLVVTKTVNNGTPDVGTDVTFTMTVKNNGPSDATGVTVTDILKSGYTYVSSTPSKGTYNNTTGVWQVGGLAAGVTETLTVMATVKTSGDYTNNVSATGTEKDNDPSNNSKDTATVPVAVADLAITKVASNMSPDKGTEIDFTLTVTNKGISDAHNVKATDLLPTGYSYVSSTPSVGAYNNTTGVWTIGNLSATAGSNTATLGIKVKVNAVGTGDDYKNVATVTGDEKDPVTTNNADSTKPVPVEIADLSVTKTVSDKTPDVGTNVTFTITAANAGVNDATGVVVKDPLPSGYDYVSSTPSVGTYNNTTGDWTIGALAASGSATLTIEAKVKAAGEYKNIAIIEGPSTLKDPNTDNNLDSARTTPVPVADLAVTKTVNNGTPDVGTDVTFTMTVKNNGPSDATGVTVTDILKSGYTYVSSTPSKGTYNNTTGVWQVGGLAAGVTETLTVTATVKTSGDYTNNVSATGTEKDNDPSNNSKDTATVPVAVADLTITKVASNMSPDKGTEIDFTLTVTNKGISDAHNVKATDLLPTGYSYISSTPSVGSYNNTTGVWTIGNLSATTGSNTATLGIKVKVNAVGTGDDYKNVATVTGDEKDPVTTNNTDSTKPVPVEIADLSVTKTVSDKTPDVGSNVTFTITAANAGVNDATGVVVKDPLPTGYDYVSSTPSVGTYNNTTGDWTIGALAASGSATLTIEAKVKAAGEYKNIAIIEGPSTLKDPNTDNNLDSARTTPVPVADLAVTKTVNNGTPDVGTDVTFTMTVKNNGPSDATGVTVTDILKSGYTYVSSTPSKGTYNNTTGVWQVGGLAAGVTETLTVTATVKTSGDYTNNVSATGTEKDNDPSNNSKDTATVPVAVADLAITKVASNMSPDKGTEIDFTLTVTNKGISDAHNVKATDLLPTGYSYISSTPSVGSYNNTTGVWTIGDLSATTGSNTATLGIKVKVNAVGTGDDYKNVATVTGDEKDPVTTNNTDSTKPVPVEIADLSVTKTVSDKTPDVGSNVTFTITAANAGVNDATGVVVKDPLPTGYDYVSSTPSVGTYNNTTGDWTIGALAASGSATLTIEAKVKAAGEYKNIAIIEGPSTLKDPNTDNNLDSARTTPVPVADLAVTKTVNNGTPDVGTDVTFTMTVKNNGPSDATGVTVTDILKSGYTYVSSTPSKGTYNNTTGVWQVGGLAAGVTETLTVTATVKTSGDYTNNVSATGTEKDNDPSNNSKDTATVPVAVADLAITKVASSMSPDKGTEIDFTLTVTNKGISDAHNVKATDLLPTGYTYVSSTPSVGSYNNTTGVWTIGNLSATTGSNTATLSIKVKVNAVGTGDDYKNVATVTGDEKDPVTTNNADSTKPVPVEIADLSVTKTVSNKTPDVGTNVTFTITAANAGVNDATGVVVKDPLPSGYDYVSSTPSVGTYNNTTGNWTIGTLAASGSATLTIEAKVKAAGEYNNIATIEGSSSLKDPNTNNNLDSARTTPVPVVDLVMDKSVDNDKPDEGSNVQFTLKVTNNGPSDATGVTANDLLPAGYTYVSSTASVGTYNAQTGVWGIQTLANGGTATLTIIAKVKPEATQYTNTANVTSTEKDSNPVNNTDDASTVPVPVADLELHKTASVSKFNVGDQITYTVTVKNNGPSTSKNVSVKDVLGAGLTYISSSTTKTSYDATTGIWTIGDLENGVTATLTMVVKTTATDGYVNTATASSATTKDNNANNNEEAVTITKNRPPVAVDDNAATEEPTPVIIHIQNNDSAPDGTLVPGSVVIVGQPQHGTVTTNADGTVTYTPNDGYEGTDVFTYKEKDSNGSETNVATVTVTVTKRKVDLAIVKKIVTPTNQIQLGKDITFDITVTNKSTKNGTGVEVADILAANLGGNDIKLETQTGTAVYDATNKRITWTIGTLNGGASATLTVTAKIIEGGNVSNTATVIGTEEDPDLSNNTSTASQNVGQEDLFIPNVITPNGDGKNDKFIILGLPKYPGSSIMIYNRWGNMVYQSSDYKNDWTGEGLNDGTYYYVLTVNKPTGKQVYKGWIQKLN